MIFKNDNSISDNNTTKEITNAKKRRDLRLLVLGIALFSYLIISVYFYQISIIPVFRDLILPITIGISLAFFSMLYSEISHYETTKQLLELRVEKKVKNYQIPSSIKELKFIHNHDLESFITNFDILLTIQLELAKSILTDKKKRDVIGLLDLCKQKQESTVNNLREFASLIPPVLLQEFKDQIDITSYTNEMLNLENVIHGESLSNDEKLEATEEVSDSVKGAIVKGINLVTRLIPQPFKGLVEKIVSGLDIVDEVINIIRKIF